MVAGAVNGYCITGGLEIALSCDWLLASEKAVFMDTHVKFGLAPCWGLSQRLSRLVGYGRAQMMSYTAGTSDHRFVASERGRERQRDRKIEG